MLSIYDFLAKATPYRGNWDKGRKRTNDLLKDAP